MIFEKELISIDILDVLELKQKNVNMVNAGRNFDALSFRFRADTRLKTEDREHHLHDGSVCFVPARLNYSRYASVDELIVVHFNTANYVPNGIEHFYPENSEIIAEIFREILDCWQNKDVGYKYKCSSLFNRILYECYKQNFKGDPSGSKIENAVAYLNANYKKPDLSIKEIAEKSFISEVYFRKLFKAEFGISPQKYIIKLRIQNAVGLISTGYYTLGEVAYMSGYNDYKYFSAEFKRMMGLSPSEYLYNYDIQQN